MTRDVLLAGRAAKLTVEGRRLRYQREDGESIEAQFSFAPGANGSFTVVLDCDVFTVVPEAEGAVVNGARIALQVFDPRDKRARNGSGAAEGRQQIASPMPGKVIRVLAAAGDEVEEGQGLVVVEAMKMQNEMKSPKAGRVVEIRVKVDATIAAGDILIVVE